MTSMSCGVAPSRQAQWSGTRLRMLFGESGTARSLIRSAIAGTSHNGSGSSAVARSRRPQQSCSAQHRTRNTMMKTSTWGVVLALSQVIVSATQAASTAPQTRVLDQLTPDNSVVLLIDYQPQYAFSTRSTDIDSLVNNAVGLAKAARVFKVPTVVTTITAQAFAGPLLQPLKAATEIDPIDRTVINAWRDERVSKAVRATG